MRLCDVMLFNAIPMLRVRNREIEKNKKKIPTTNNKWTDSIKKKKMNEKI